MPAHHYRITVEKLDTVDMPQRPPGEGGLESVSFFASTTADILSTAATLRHSVDFNSCDATQVALAIALLSQVIGTHCDRTLLAPLHQPMHELFRSLAEDAAISNA